MNVYRERAYLVALLCAIYPATLVYGADPSEPDWPVVFVDLPTGQASWHISPGDISVFDDVRSRNAGDPDAPIWDGHSTLEKYERIAKFAYELNYGVTP